MGHTTRTHSPRLRVLLRIILVRRQLVGCSLIAGMVLCTTGCSSVRPDRAFDVVSGLISHNLCSEVFISGLDPAQVYDESLKQRGGMGLISWAVRYDVDRARSQVSTTVGGAFAHRAVYRHGLGCLLVHDDQPVDSAAGGAATADGRPPTPLLPDLAGTAVVDPINERLRAAVDRAFIEPGRCGDRHTRAVVVVHDGRIIAERYAPNYGPDTPLLGYSVSKSVISTLIGILVRQGRLVVDQPAPVAQWSDAGDPRGTITIDQLLRMTSGLALDETQSPFNPVARMLYLERDMAAFAESTALETEPGRTWNYTSGNTLILSRIIRDAVGGDAAHVLEFARRELFDPLGMRSVTLEFDATGTPVGSTYMLASARDWARFGLLYLYDGVIGERRILPEGWVRYSSTPTLATGYGAGFWTNRVDGNIPWSRVPWGMRRAPRDAFFARGLLGQYVVVVPSARLVVTRFGVTHTPGADIEGIGDLVADVIDALGGGSTNAAVGEVQRSAPSGR